MRTVSVMFSGEQGLIWVLLWQTTAAMAGSSGTLQQGGNGSFGAPVSPVSWQSGNLNTNNSHYVEGQSVPYRLVLTGLTNGPHVAVIEWDIVSSGKNAIDYITYYDRIAEGVNPVLGLSGPFGSPSAAAIPAPVPSLTVNGLPQPQTSFGALAAADRVLTIYNGTITSLAYINNSQGNLGDLSASQSSSDLQILFVATNSTVVLAWGGHVASRLDWGIGSSAGGIGGSPYHTRLISVDGSGGNQDRSLKAIAVCTPPVNSVSGPGRVCGGTLNSYTDLSDGASFNWTVTGDATLVGPMTNASVTVQAGPTGSYTVSVTASAPASMGGCSSSASQAVTVDPLPMCQINGPSALCPLSVSNSYAGPEGMAGYSWAISGNGGIVGPTNLPIVTVTAGNFCGQPFTLTLQVMATNGCVSACSQSVPVGDTSTPGFVVFPPDVSEECPGDTTPAATGTPTGADACAFTVSYRDLLVDGNCSNKVVRTITRTWTVSDICSNGFSQNQLITVKDTTPPSFVTFPADAVVECPGSTLPAATGQPAGTDTCSTITITYADTTVSGNCSNKVVTLITRAWTATDACGNSVTQNQLITVKDTTPPQLVCQSNLVVAEAPRDSGGATVTFLLPPATDTCDANPQVFSAPAAGDVFPLGSNAVTCTASDACGNSNSCTFDVRVIPYRLFVTNTLDAGPGSLRQALLDANDSPDQNLVLFHLPGTGPYTIHLLSALPQITSPLILDGWSQLGSNGPPLIALDGSTTSNQVDGLVLTAGSNTVRGLIFNGFVNALRLQTNGHNVIQGNYIGADFTGTNLVGNSGNGIYIDSASNVVGGTLAGMGNLIAGNQRNGIDLAPTAGFGNALLGNSIFDNGALGIDLGDDGVTLNGTRGPAGPNHFQSFPVPTNAQSSAGVTTVSGQFGGAPFGTYRIEFFLNDAPDPTGYGEGQFFLGAIQLQLDGSGQASFSVPLAVAAVYTQFVTATATDPAGNTSEFSPAVQVHTPPVIDFQPVGVSPPAGAPTTFCAVVSGTPPIFYQWRLNGINLAGATNSCYTIPAAQVAQGGTYTVLVQNGLGASATLPATLTLSSLPSLPAGDNFAERVPISGTNGTVTGSNVNATSEPGEPMHAGKPGGKSVWYRWTAPVTGVVTLQTVGSTFNTLLAVYTGSVVSNLAPIAAAASQEADFYTSQVLFNAFQGTQYQIAIDGFAGASGQFVLAWKEQNTSHMLPVFLVPPTSQTVTPGQTATLSALGARVCGNGQTNCAAPNPEQVNYQWFFYGSPIPGATASTLIITNVQPALVGNYTLRIYTPWQTNESDIAVLQINLTGTLGENVQAMDQFADAANGNPLVIGAITGGSSASQATSASVVSGYTGTQVFNTGGSGASPTELICGIIGGSSEWMTLVPQTSGTLYLNTYGSSFATVMAAFRRSATNPAVLVQVPGGCDVNSGTNGIASVIAFPVAAGQTNYLDVDGVGGAMGVLQLNYSLVSSAGLRFVGLTPQGAPHIQVVGHAGMNFTLQATTNFLNWVPLLTTTATNATFDYVDTSAPAFGRRYYRALLLP